MAGVEEDINIMTEISTEINSSLDTYSKISQLN